MHERTLAFLATLTLALLATGNTDAQTIYRWVDINGTVHFGERPPQGVKSEVVKVSADKTGTVSPQIPTSHEEPADSDTTKDADTGAPVSYAQQLRNERAEKRRKRQEEQKQTAQKCATMHKVLDYMEPHPKVIVKTEDGGTRRLSDEERLKQVNDAKSYIQANCP